jgi:hypothetical protein
MTDCPRESHRLDAKFRGRDPQSQIEIIDRDQNLATKLKHQDGTERTGISYLLTDVICGIARPLSNGQQRIFAHRHRLGINQRRFIYDRFDDGIDQNRFDVRKRRTKLHRWL